MRKMGLDQYRHPYVDDPRVQFLTERVVEMILGLEKVEDLRELLAILGDGGGVVRRLRHHK